MIYGYTRETPGGASQKEKFEKQKEMLKEEGVGILVTDSAPSGKRKKFDGFNRMFVKLRQGDTLVIPSIDRVSHSATDFEGLMAGLLNRGVAIRILNLGTLDDSEEGRMRQQSVRAFAEFEKAMVVERTQVRKAESRKDLTFREGRPRKYGRREISAALRLLDNNSYKLVSEMTGISVSTLTRARSAERARKSGDYSMSDAEVREYEAAVARSEQMTLQDLLGGM